MSPKALLFGGSALVVAFSSMAYELTLAQCMAVLYGDTITSYSLVIGFFVLSLGLGSAYWARSTRPMTVRTFWNIEIVLAALGAAVPFILFMSEFGGAGRFPSGMVAALAMALAIGFFSGMEIPLLIALAKDESRGPSSVVGLVIGLDFLGTFLASVVVPLWLFLAVGLVGVPLIGALLNLALGAAALIGGQRPHSPVRLALTVLMALPIWFALGRIEIIEDFLSRGVF